MKVSRGNRLYKNGLRPVDRVFCYGEKEEYKVMHDY